MSEQMMGNMLFFFFLFSMIVLGSAIVFATFYHAAQERKAAKADAETNNRKEKTERMANDTKNDQDRHESKRCHPRENVEVEVHNAVDAAEIRVELPTIDKRQWEVETQSDNQGLRIHVKSVKKFT